MKGPSHNVEIERSLLGGLMLASHLVAEVAAVLAIEDFARPAHQLAYRMMLDLHRRDGLFDLTTFMDEVDRRGNVEQCGGVSYVTGYMNACVSVASVPGYAARIKDHALRRRLQLLALSISESVEDGQQETGAIIDAAEAAIFALSRGARPESSWRSAADLVPVYLEALQVRAGSSGLTGIPTGLRDLDARLCGWQPGDLVVLAARPGVGKTALALNFARAAAKAGVGVGVFSMEMRDDQLIGRLLCADGPVDAGHARTGQLNPDEWPRMLDAAQRVGALPISIDATPGQTIGSLRAAARRLRIQCPALGLLIVDYLQLMGGDGSRNQNREGVISEISRGLKVLAKELNMPVIALSQLNRSLEARSDKHPMLSDLRESGAIEQDADVVLFLYRDEVHNPDTRDVGIAEINIAKHREGEGGTVRCSWIARHLRFLDL